MHGHKITAYSNKEESLRNTICSLSKRGYWITFALVSLPNMEVKGWVCYDIMYSQPQPLNY